MLQQKSWLRRLLLGFCAAFPMSFLASTSAQDHLIITSQDALVGKEIAVYRPDGTKVFSHVTEGGHTENTPTYIVADPATRLFLVTCPGPEEGHGHDHDHDQDNHDDDHDDHHHHHDFEGHSVLIFDASDPENIVLVEELHTGLKPYHAYRSPDGKFVVGNDNSGTLAIIDPMDPDHFDLVEAGHDHTSLVFAGDASHYDIYAARFGNPGGMDIVDGSSLAPRAQLGGLLPNPHTGVYSSHTERVYFGHRGGIEVFGTTGPEQDQHLGTIAMDEGQMIPYSVISPDGRYLYGGVHYDGVEGSYFYAVDLEDDSIATVPSVSCKFYAFSPDGKWIVAGDFNRPASQGDYKVHVIDADPTSSNFMTVVQEFSSPSSRIGFHTAAFSPDSRYAYLGLPTTDQLMVVDVQALDFSIIDLPINAAPRWLRVLSLEPQEPPLSNVNHWTVYE